MYILCKDSPLIGATSALSLKAILGESGDKVAIQGVCLLTCHTIPCHNDHYNVGCITKMTWTFPCHTEVLFIWAWPPNYLQKNRCCCSDCTPRMKDNARTRDLNFTSFQTLLLTMKHNKPMRNTNFFLSKQIIIIIFYIAPQQQLYELLVLYRSTNAIQHTSICSLN